MSVPDTLGVPLAALPETRAATQSDVAAIADEAVALDNAAFADRVARAALLARLGVGPGDVVAIALPNRLEQATRGFAVRRLARAER
jgi:long-chain acyl-CoA synthetase